MLGFMALGNYLGGKLADRVTSPDILFWVLVSLSVSIALVTIFESLLLGEFAGLSSIRTGMVIGSILLFCLPCTLFGVVTPATTRLRLRNLQSSGANMGGLYALSTLGSIVGAFVTGFWLMALVGSSRLLALIAVLVMILALSLAFPLGSHPSRKILALLVAFACIVGAFVWRPISPLMTDLRPFDTAYDRYMVGELEEASTGRLVRYLSHNPRSMESAVYADTYEPYIFDYYRYYDLALDIAPAPRSTLLIGGGVLVYPRHQIKQYPDSRIDVVEIDPALYTEASNNFGYLSTPQIRLTFEDGRVFLNKTNKHYDAVILDAFKSSNNVPFQLTTRESMQRCYSALNEGGVLVMNVLASYKGDGARFINAQYKTLKEVFPQVEVYLVTEGERPQDPQNISLIAYKGTNRDLKARLQKADAKLASRNITLDAEGAPMLTDDFAPVDQLLLNVNK